MSLSTLRCLTTCPTSSRFSLDLITWCVLLLARSVVKRLKPRRNTARNVTSGSLVYRGNRPLGPLASLHPGRPVGGPPFPRRLSNAPLARTP
jgi:hypothetical protein